MITKPTENYFLGSTVYDKDVFFNHREGKYYLVLFAGDKRVFGEDTFTLLRIAHPGTVEIVLPHQPGPSILAYLIRHQDQFLYRGNDTLLLTTTVKEPTMPLHEAAEKILERWDDIADILNIEYTTGGAFNDNIRQLRESLEEYKKNVKG